jgi:NAD(P) transhydrogenase beta subunit/Alanine dehydrogenase/PNT, C-terminal domain
VTHGGVKILGPVNLPASPPYHASEMYSRNLFNLLKPALVKGELAIDWNDEAFAYSGNEHNLVHLTMAAVGGFIGAVSFSGSLIAFAKLQGLITKSVRFSGQKFLNLAILLIAVGPRQACERRGETYRDLHTPIRLPHHSPFVPLSNTGAFLAPLAAFETLPGTGGHPFPRLRCRACRY